MKKFDEFVIHIVKKWKKEKKLILEKGGLVGLSNREYGDLAEDYIVRKINKLIPSYKVYKSNGSQTPTDIFAVGRRKDYWHIMLIQVKSSDKKENIYDLNEKDQKVFNVFTKFVIGEIKKSGYLSDYCKKPIIITTGYVKVLRYGEAISHRLVEGMPLKMLAMNAKELDTKSIGIKASNLHRFKKND